MYKRFLILYGSLMGLFCLSFFWIDKISHEEKKERIKNVLESNQLSNVLRKIDFRKFNIKKQILFFCMKKKLANIVLLIGRG